MQISSNTPDTLSALLKNAATATPMPASANPASQTKDADDTLANRPATLQNFSPAAQAIIKRAEADKAVATKLQTALATLKGKAPNDTQKPEDTTGAKLFGILNSTTAPKAISAYPIPNGNDLVQTTDARENRTVIRQEIMDDAIKIMKVELENSITESWVEKARADSFKKAFRDGTFNIMVIGDDPTVQKFIDIKATYYMSGSHTSFSVDQGGLENYLGKYAQTMTGDEYGTVILTWGSKTSPETPA